MTDGITIAGVDVSGLYTPEQLDAVSYGLMASDAEYGSGTLPIPEDGSLVTYAGQHLVHTDAGVVIFDGYLGERNRERATNDINPRRVLTVSTADTNALLHGRVAYKWKRPKETDRARMLAFADHFLPGSVTTTWVLSTNTKSMPAKVYTTEDLISDLQSDMGDLTGKTAFMSGRDFHWHLFTEGDTAGLAISDVDGEYDQVTTFFPTAANSPTLRLDPADLCITAVAYNSKGQTASYTDAAKKLLHDASGVRHEKLIDVPDGTLADLQDAAKSAVLNNRAERFTYECEIGPLTPAQVALLPVGSLMSVTSQLWGLTASTQRIAQLTLTKKGTTLWMAKVSMAYPVRRRQKPPSIATPTSAADGSSGQQPLPPPGTTVTGTVTDTFNRADTVEVAGTSQLGVASCGRTWTRSSGAAYISGDKGVWDSGVMHLPGPWPLAAISATVKITAFAPAPASFGFKFDFIGHGPTGTLTFDCVYGGSATAAFGTLTAQILDGTATAANSVAASMDYSPTIQPIVTIDSFGMTFQIGADSVTVLYTDGNLYTIPAATDMSGDLILAGSSGLTTFEDLSVTGVTGTDSSTVIGLPPAFAGQRYGPIDIGFGDGSSTVFTFPYAYTPGSLSITVDSTYQNVTELDPAAGTFSLAFAPLSSERIFASAEISPTAGVGGTGGGTSSGGGSGAGVGGGTSADAYGSAALDTKANMQLGGTEGDGKGQCAVRFVASTTSALDSVQFEQRGGPVYSSQDAVAGSFTITICADAGGVPGAVLATESYSPSNGNPTGPWTIYDSVTFGSPPSLTAGTTYYFVIRNDATDMASGYFSINHVFCFTAISPRQPFVSDAAFAVLQSLNGGLSWAVEDQFTAVIDLVYADATHDGQAYIGNIIADFGTITGASDMVREQFTMTGGDKVVDAVSVRMRRDHGSSPLTVILEVDGGSVLEEIDIPASLVPASTAGGDDGGSVWVTAAFSTDQTLVNGTTYNLRLVTDTDTAYTAACILQGDSQGFGSFAFRDGGGEKTTNGGVSWSALYAFDDVDIQFSFRRTA